MTQGKLQDWSIYLSWALSSSAWDRLYCHYQWLCCCKIEKSFWSMTLDFVSLCGSCRYMHDYYTVKLIWLTRCWHVTISCQPDGRTPQPVRPWKSRTRSLSNATFSFFDHVMKIGWFFTDIWQYINFQSGGRPPSWNCFTTIRDHSRSPCQISCQSDTQIWIYSCLNFSHVWLEMPIQVPKIEVLGDFGPLIVIIHHREPQKAHPCVNRVF